MVVNDGVAIFETGLPDGEYSAHLRPWKEKRSVSQNNYLHAVLNEIAESTGNTMHDVKESFRQMFLRAGNVVVGSHILPTYRSTADLDLGEMATFIDQIRNFSASELGLYIPSPDERTFSDWYNLRK